MDWDSWDPDRVPDFDLELPACDYCGAYPTELDRADWLNARMVLPDSPNGLLDTWYGFSCRTCREYLEATIEELPDLGWTGAGEDVPLPPVLIGEPLVPCSLKERERMDDEVNKALERAPLLARRVRPQARSDGRCVIVVDDPVRARMRWHLRHVQLDTRWHAHVPHLRGRGRVEVQVQPPHGEVVTQFEIGPRPSS